ncbi:MAG: hypothetical protein U0802_14405 [Candidatus Binatia bacterium]
MRTALYEGHIGRGCSAYGACERNVIALSIRNRAVERCLAGQGCRQAGDFEGVSSAVAQYNIWDEYLTQTTGPASCTTAPRSRRRGAVRRGCGRCTRRTSATSSAFSSATPTTWPRSSPTPRRRSSRACATTTTRRRWASASPTPPASSTSPPPSPAAAARLR